MSFAGAMKPFFLIPYIAFVFVFFLKQWMGKKTGLKDWFYLIPFVLVGVWFYYVGWYNLTVKTEFFLSSTRSIWSLTPETLNNINAKIINKWWSDYFHPIYLYVLALIGIAIVFWKPNSNKKTILFLCLSILGCIAFLLLFYGMLQDHDYYIFPVLFIAPLIMLILLNYVSKRNWHFGINYSMGAVILSLIFIGTSYSWRARQNRLKNPNIKATNSYVNYKGLDNFLIKHGVNDQKFVIAYSDKTPNYALMLMNRKGWSGYQTFYQKKTINQLIKKGAEYLIVNERVPLKRDSVALENVDMTYLGDTNQIYLYQLH